MAKGRAKGKKAAKAKAASSTSSSGAIREGGRVEVVKKGSFAYGCRGTVSSVDGADVYVMLDHKRAPKVFPPSHLRALES
jgi:hypothetical protein